ncbi:MAG: hypothetical protein AAFQ94_21310 [Bacteroidota bacterium]
MKTIFAYFTIVFLFFAGSNAFGQGDYIFRVLANKGNNSVKKSDGKTVGLKTGSTLKAGDQLIASSNSYIGLMHKTGKTLEVRQAGVLKVNDLVKKVAAKKTSVTGRYAQYVMNKINDDGVSDNYRRNNNVTGAVTRGAEFAIGFVLPVEDNKIKVYTPNFVLRWVPAPEEGQEISFDGKAFNITIKNIFDEVIYKQETNKTSVILNLDEIKNESSLFLIQVTSIEEEAANTLKSIEYAIERVSLDDNPEFKAEMDAVLAEVETETSVGKLVLASFYEEKGLLLEAMTQYEEIISSNPEVDAFQELYKEFLAKNEMVIGTKKSDEE